jgi:hypothetical protein
VPRRTPFDSGLSAPAAASHSTSRFSCMYQTPPRVLLFRGRVHDLHLSGLLFSRITPSRPLITCKFKPHSLPPPFRLFRRRPPLFFLTLRPTMTGRAALVPRLRHRHRHQPQAQAANHELAPTGVISPSTTWLSKYTDGNALFFDSTDNFLHGRRSSQFPVRFNLRASNSIRQIILMDTWC